MAEAKFHESFISPTDIEELKQLPLRDFTYYRLAWFLENRTHYEAYQILVQLITQPGLTVKEPEADTLYRFMCYLGLPNVLPEEYFLYHDTIGVVESILINQKAGFTGNIAIDVYVKVVQDTHRVYSITLVPAANGLKAQVRLEITECTSSNVNLPGKGTRDVRLLFRNASMYFNRDIPEDQPPEVVKDSMATSNVVYYNDDEVPVVSSRFWVDGEEIFHVVQPLPADQYIALCECERHHR